MNLTKPLSEQGFRVSTWPARILVVFLALTCARVWMGSMFDAASAQAQNTPPPFDATAQRKDVADELKKVNATLEAILSTLKTGTINVRAQSEGSAAPTAPSKKK